MCFIIRNITCPSCGAKYRVEAKNKLALVALVLVGVFSIPYVEGLLPANINWFANIIVIGVVVLLVPLNQRLEKIA